MGYGRRHPGIYKRHNGNLGEVIFLRKFNPCKKGCKTMAESFVDTAKLYYRLPGNGAGGNLHLVLDDGNCDDDSMWVCIKSCVKESDKMGLYIAATMLFTMTEEQREKLYCDVAGIDYQAWLNDTSEVMPIFDKRAAWARIVEGAK